MCTRSCFTVAEVDKIAADFGHFLRPQAERVVGLEADIQPVFFGFYAAPPQVRDAFGMNLDTTRGN